MPRPSKRVAPDTLGGRLRAARQNMRLSLAQVAADKYSTSLISQIERNRVDPSAESLQYLAQRLKLSHEDLVVLARQHRESETEATLYKDYEERYAEINRLLAHNQPDLALDRFKELSPERLPMFLRWRALALRGQSYFEQRKFSDAQRDFHSALAIMPNAVEDENQLEVVSMRLHLAAATRELNQFETAREYYEKALEAMNATTPLKHVAEAHWGFALVYYRKGQDLFLPADSSAEERALGQTFLEEAWSHADGARILYTSIADHLNAALLQCQIARIEQALGQTNQARTRLLAVLQKWQPMLDKGYRPEQGSWSDETSVQANVVSAAACYLAGVESQVGHLDEALAKVELAIQASQISVGYKVRQAEAYMTKGQILEALAALQPKNGNGHDPDIEQTFRHAVQILKNTDRRAVRTQAHYLLGRYLLSIGEAAEGRREIDKASELAGIPRSLDIIRPADERSSNDV